MKDEILIKYFLGEAAVDEVTQVEAWLQESSQHQRYLLELRKVWDQSQLLEQGNSYNTEAQWQLLKSKMNSDSGVKVDVNATAKAAPESGRLFSLNEMERRRSSRKFQPWGWVAALLVLILGCWVVFHQLFSTKGQAGNLILTAVASPVTDTLSDGSVITLNHYSRLQAPLKFNGKTREVTLKEGEAFFKVVHQEKKPFLVHSGAVDIKVLGTSFNIKMEGDNTVINVATGKVLVAYKNQQLILTADQQLSINHATVRLSSEKTGSLLYNYYVTQQFVANNTRLEDLVTVLNEAYGQHIVFGNNALKELRITTVFAKQPIDNILDVISETFGIQVVHNKDTIVLQ